MYDLTEGRESKEITKEVAQGSILGPNLWNIIYNKLVTTKMLEECRLVDSANDVSILIQKCRMGLTKIECENQKNYMRDGEPRT